MLKQAVLHIAKVPFMGKAIGTIFRYFWWVIPVKKVYNSKDSIAFYHPKPSYKNHIVIVPKRAIANLQQLASEEFQEYFVMLLRTVKKIYAAHPEYRDSFVLVANGGKRQEVSQVHFHMFTDYDVVNAKWEFHRVIPAAESGQITNEYCKDILQNIELLNKEFSIVKKGYSLVYQYEKKTGDTAISAFHIVAGKKLSY
ncbi:MAG: HIT domain-containing protein [Lachnospiraceae bacterium]|nr:HIT domain-containing protein [Lachnospiraceae bacterium]